MKEFTLQNVLAWCKDVGAAADGIVQTEKDEKAREYWSGQRDALKDLAWLIQWKLDGEPEFPQIDDPIASLGEE